jgi:hypothetical protein
MVRALMAGLVTVVGLTLAPVPGAAAEEEEALAREHNNRAIAAFRAGDLHAALQEFQHAHALSPDPRIRLNLALTHDGLGHLDDAKRELELFLVEEPRDKKARAVRRRIRELDTKMTEMGKVLVVMEPAPDRARLGPHALPRLPASVWLEPGTHVLTAEKAGYAPVRQEVEVKAGRRTKSQVTMERLAAPGPGSAPADGTPALVDTVPGPATQVTGVTLDVPPEASASPPATAPVERPPARPLAAAAPTPAPSPEPGTDPDALGTVEWLQIRAPPKETPPVTYAPGVVAGAAATFLVAFLGDAVGSLVALVPVVGLLGLLGGGVTSLVCAPTTGWLVGTQLAKRRVSWTRSVLVTAGVHLAFLPLRLLFLGTALAPMAVLAGLGLRFTLVEGNFFLLGSYRDPTVLAPVVWQLATLAGCGACVTVTSCGSALAQLAVLRFSGRFRRSWESAPTCDVLGVPTVRRAWLEDEGEEDE